MSNINILESQNINKEENVPTETVYNLEESSTKFSRKTIEKLGNKVRMSDSNDKGLELFCYNNCSSDDDEDLIKCRGIVFHGDTIVMKAFPYTIEYSENDNDKIETNINSVLKDCAFYDSYEGSLIRMFFFDGQWYLSTHRKLNAFKSKWASKESFGTSFKRALETEINNNNKLREVMPDNDESLLDRFQSILDKNKQYMFLILNSEENRIVCFPPENPTVFHVGTFVDGNLVLTEDCHIPQPKKHEFNDINSLLEYVSQVDIRYLQGIICFAPDNKQYKVYNSSYFDLFQARGNEPSIKFRYLQVRMNRRYLSMLEYLYPKMINSFEEIENNIYDIAKKIYKSYVDRFIKKLFVSVAEEEFFVIRACHKWHEENKIQNRINLDKVIDILNKQNPTLINHLIRSRMNEIKIKKNENV
jgi:hypothetical protein